MTLAQLNDVEDREATSVLLACCGSQAWAHRMTAERPFTRFEELEAAADRVWLGLERSDWLEAFAAHPRIGERTATPADAFPTFQTEIEQRGALAAPEDVRARIADANRAYEARFGYIFIICASGRSGAAMLAECERRLANDPESELRVAAEEQRKITRLRLRRAFEQEGHAGT